MSKPILIGLGGGKAKVVHVWAPIHRILTAFVRFTIRRAIKAADSQKHENNCPVMVETADGIPARCMFYMADGKTCPRHGDVSEIQKP